MLGDDDYVCALDEKSIEKAKKELNENPADRLSSVQALRQWIKDQPHLHFRTDTNYLLQILRTRKFSQIESRNMVERNIRTMKKYPEWYSNIDPADPKIQAVIDTGVFVPLPGRDKNGRKVFISDRGNIKCDTKEYNHVDDFVKTAFVVHSYVHAMDENIHVNGVSQIFDFTKFTLKHQKDWGIEQNKKLMKCWIGNFPGRFKDFNMYNAGNFADFVLMVFRTFAPKKISDRITTHNNLESLYDLFPKSMLPVEYLPDDYEGPNAGTMQELIDELKEGVKGEKFRKEFLYYTSDAFWIDDSKRPANEVIQQSFRKLNID